MHNDHSAVVIGGSLSGLMATLSLARVGMRVTVLERSADTGRTGAVLHVPQGLIPRLTGRRDAGTVSLLAGPQTWHGVHRALRSAAELDPKIAIVDGVTVTEVAQDARSAWAVCSDGRRFAADVVIGADGHRSVARREVAPERPDATFAGYLIWIGVAQEAGIDPRQPWPRDIVMLSRKGDHMFGGPMPNGDKAKVGERQLAWAWYDASRNDILRRTGAVMGNVVQHSLRGGDMTDAELEGLDRSAQQRWPSMWHQAIRDCIRRRTIIGTPITEYVPDRLVKGRVALVGDAAHVPTPMTGNGFGASLSDAEALADGLEHQDDVVRALQDYERERLRGARSLVQSGQDFSRSFARAG